MISGGGTFYPGRRSLANSQNAGAEDSSALALTQKLDLIVTSLEENKAMFVGLKNDMATMQCDLANMKEKMDDLVKEETDRKSVVKPVRRKLPNELSAAVKALHSATDDCTKFDGSELYSSEHNVAVKNYLLNHLAPKFKDKHSPKRLNAAIHRYYESRRRLFNDEQPGRIEAVLKTKIETRKRQLRKKLYSDRCKVLKSDKEKQLWSNLDYNYMTEESEHETEDGEIEIHCHSLPWRSQNLTKLVNKLKKRISPLKAPMSLKLSKEPSQLLPPQDCPSWALSYEYNRSLNSITCSPSESDTITPISTPSSSRMSRTPLSSSSRLNSSTPGRASDAASCSTSTDSSNDLPLTSPISNTVKRKRVQTEANITSTPNIPVAVRSNHKETSRKRENIPCRSLIEELLAQCSESHSDSSSEE